MPVTNQGKRLIAEAMYTKGKNFIGAALLVRGQGGSEYVVLHLLCQGVEIVLKSLLLLKDFDSYENKLRKPLGHDLNKTVAAVRKAFGVGRVSPELAAELERLNDLYKGHLLRYASPYDVFIDPKSIPSKLTLRRIGAVIRLAERQLSATAMPE